ncbi:hypothetical protein RQP46_010876 [Phenoliferia psychrophenolica]
MKSSMSLAAGGAGDSNLDEFGGEDMTAPILERWSEGEEESDLSDDRDAGRGMGVEVAGAALRAAIPFWLAPASESPPPTEFTPFPDSTPDNPIEEPHTKSWAAPPASGKSFAHLLAQATGPAPPQPATTPSTPLPPPLEIHDQKLRKISDGGEDVLGRGKRMRQASTAAIEAEATKSPPKRPKVGQHQSGSQKNTEKPLELGQAAMFTWPDYTSPWPAVIIDRSEADDLPFALVSGMANDASILVKSLPTGGYWAYAQPSQLSRIDPSSPPSPGRAWPSTDHPSFRAGVELALSPTNLKAWLEAGETDLEWELLAEYRPSPSVTTVAKGKGKGREKRMHFEDSEDEDLESKSPRTFQRHQYARKSFPHFQNKPSSPIAAKTGPPSSSSKPAVRAPISPSSATSMSVAPRSLPAKQPPITYRQVTKPSNQTLNHARPTSKPSSAIASAAKPAVATPSRTPSKPTPKPKLSISTPIFKTRAFPLPKDTKPASSALPPKAPVQSARAIAPLKKPTSSIFHNPTSSYKSFSTIATASSSKPAPSSSTPTSDRFPIGSPVLHRWVGYPEPSPGVVCDPSSAAMLPPSLISGTRTATSYFLKTWAAPSTVSRLDHLAAPLGRLWNKSDAFIFRQGVKLGCDPKALTEWLELPTILELEMVAEAKRKKR